MSETFLLAAMAYDRYVAICCPLRYSYLMNLKICIRLSLILWGFGLLESLVLTGLIFRCSFTKSKEINHFFCDLESLLKLSSSGTAEAHMVLLVSTFICGFIPMLFILVTYVFVIYNILKIRSSKGKQKAFSTCSSHLTVITLFLGIILRTYFRPKTENSIQEDKILLLLYTSCIPALNPIIYSLRNKDVHVAVKNLKQATQSQIVTHCEYFCYKQLLK
ncbi:olfactory receptor 5V1-like [Mantella aurantiaca]